MTIPSYMTSFTTSLGRTLHKLLHKLLRGRILTHQCAWCTSISALLKLNFTRSQRWCRDLLIVIASFLWGTHAFAQQTAIEQFKSFVNNNKTAKGEFSQQQIKMEKGQAKLGKLSSGVFKFSRPGKFIWIYQKPYEQILQSDGDTLYMYDKDLNQLTTKKLTAAIGASPAAILFGSNDLEKNFTLKNAQVKEGVAWLEATPKSADSQFEQIHIGMKEGMMVGMELKDSFGQYSTITFKNYEKNPKFTDKEFQFDTPKGVDVIKQ